MAIDQHDREVRRGRTVSGPDVQVPAKRSIPIDRSALYDLAPILVALVPYAALIGVQIAAQRVDDLSGLSGSLLLFAGTAHLSTLTLLERGAALISILATVAVVNARFVVYGAALAPRFAGQPAWFRWLAAHFILDQTFGLVSARADLNDLSRFRRYWLTIGCAIAVVWTVAMAAGVVLGPALPSSAALAFMPIAIFASLLAMALTDRAAVAAAVGAFGAAAVLPLPGGSRILAGTVAGIAAGLFAEGRRS